MSEIAIFYNAAYEQKPEEYPRQTARMKQIEETLKSLSAERRYLPVSFSGKTPEEVHRNLVEQVKSYIPTTTGEKVVIFGGDGFAGAMVNALGTVGDEDANIGAEIDAKQIMVAKGGSLNLLAKHLGSADKKALGNFVKDAVEINATETRRRILTIATQNSEAPETDVTTQDQPFILFAGLGNDAIMMKTQEDQPRSQHWAISAFNTGMSALKNAWSLKKDGFKLDAVLTIPRFGLLRFPKTYDTLGDDSFYRFQAESKNPIIMSWIGILGHLTMTHPYLAEKFLASNQPYYKLTKATKIDKEPVRRNHPNGLCFYVDGYPQIYTIANGHQATASISTVNGRSVKLANLSAA